jgi:hypothetical protein
VLFKACKKEINGKHFYFEKVHKNVPKIHNDIHKIALKEV